MTGPGGKKEFWIQRNYSHLCRVPLRLFDAAPRTLLDTMYFQDGSGHTPVLNRSSPMLTDTGDEGMTALLGHIARLDESAKENAARRGNTNLIWGVKFSRVEESPPPRGARSSLVAGATHQHSEQCTIPLARLRAAHEGADADAAAESAATGVEASAAMLFAPHSVELAAGGEVSPSFHAARTGGKCGEDLVVDFYGRAAWQMLHGFADLGGRTTFDAGYSPALQSALDGERFQSWAWQHRFTVEHGVLIGRGRAALGDWCDFPVTSLEDNLAARNAYQAWEGPLVKWYGEARIGGYDEGGARPYERHHFPMERAEVHAWFDADHVLRGHGQGR